MFLPTCREDIIKRGWDACDVVIVTPDAYIDHPSFAMALLSRFLEQHHYRVGILSQPRWRDPENFMALGRPRIAFAVSGGNCDSMVLNYTASGKPRKTDAYCTDGNPFFSVPGTGEKKYRIRPDRAVPVYCNQIRTVCRDVPVIIGGIEASLRRIAHYDWWSDGVRRSILFDAKADLLIWGMGEYPLLEALRTFERNIPPEEMTIRGTACIRKSLDGIDEPLVLPSFEDVRNDKDAFAQAFCAFYRNFDRRIIAQQQDGRYLVQFPRREVTTKDLDAVYNLPFERGVHPRFGTVPAFEMIRDSITAHRGCYGNCSFCAIAAHQGPVITSRSEESLVREAAEIAGMKGFAGTITDVGGPSANMYGSFCSAGGCENPDCLGRGKPCKNLISGTAGLCRLLDRINNIPNVNRVLVSSGVRYDPVLLDDRELTRLVRRHLPGQMKVAPESGSDIVLRLMNKPPVSVFEGFKERFDRISGNERKKRYLVPYIIVGHPGEGERQADETREFLERNRLAGRQFQIFTPSPLTRATAMYYLGFDPCSREQVMTERRRPVLEERKRRMIGERKGKTVIRGGSADQRSN